MKKFCLICLLALSASFVFGKTAGSYDLALSDTVETLVYPTEGYITIVNTGTSAVFAVFGGYITEDTYQDSFSVEPFDAYTTVGKYSVVSLICSTNGASTTVNVNKE